MEIPQRFISIVWLSGRVRDEESGDGVGGGGGGGGGVR